MLTPLRLPFSPDTSADPSRRWLWVAVLTGLLALLLASSAMAQSVGINTVPNGTAALDVASTTKGMLVPRMTTAQRNAIAAPATGLLVYDATANGFYYYTGTGWKDVSKGSATSIQNYFSPRQTSTSTQPTFLNPIFQIGASGLGTGNTFYAPESVTLTVVISSYSTSPFTVEIGTVAPPVGTVFTYGAAVAGSSTAAIPAYTSGAPQTATIAAALTAGTIYTLRVVNSTTTQGVFYTNTSAQ